MKPKPISAADAPSRTAARAGLPGIRVALITMDSHLVSATERAKRRLVADMPGLQLTLHTAADWASKPEALQHCIDEIARADIIVVTMLFMEEHFLPILPALAARRAACDAMVCAMSAREVVKLTRMGRFDMDKPASGPLSLLKRLRGSKGPPSSGGAQQMKLLRRIPQLLRFVPGTAQDVRAYFLTLQYWLGGSEPNMFNMIRFLVDRYAAGPRQALRGSSPAAAPIDYPEIGCYHPRARPAIAENDAALPAGATSPAVKGRVGLILLRSYLLAGNTAHYDGVIAALEVQGLQVVPVFAAGLDARPAIERFFIRDGRCNIDALVSLTGFSLVGGPAYNDAKAAEDILSKLDVPYVAAHPVEFQTIEQWGASERGLLPVESTIMVAIPELDGATVPMVYGGRAGAPGSICQGCHKACTFADASSAQDMQICSERTAALAARVGKLVALRRAQRNERRVAIVLFNFPPNAGNTGTAAHLAVFESVYETLRAMQAEGYRVELPQDVDQLREAILQGNARKFGSDANVHARVPVADYVRREPWLKAIESQWGPAPGRQLSDGQSIHILGAQFGNVLVAVQPSMGYEGDPMRLLFERGFAPTHAFSAFYRYLREDFRAHAVLHFGTHGALEFMPGKQTGLSGGCWPERLLGDLPNFYLYASNNPSEGTIAKRRASATLISYLTPPVAKAGLYRGLLDLKASIERYRQSDATTSDAERADLEQLIRLQAAQLDLVKPAEDGAQAAPPSVDALRIAVQELEEAMIPHGLHVVGQAPDAQQRADLLAAMAESMEGSARPSITRRQIAALVQGVSAEDIWLESSVGLNGTDREALKAALMSLENSNRLLSGNGELEGILHALDARYVRPAPGGDLLRTPDVLPGGRNLHGFDPFRIPSIFAVREGQRLARLLLDRHQHDHGALPESVAMVLWGTDNLKSEGSPLAQALALIGALPRFDSYGRLAGAVLRPLAELGRPRIDVVMTLSGIFRDLLPLQTRLLAEAAYLAASADEPSELNFVRKHALAYQREHGCDLETAALRVFGNAEGAYGSNVNHLIDNGRWSDEDELAELYSRRKGYAYGRNGRPAKQAALLNAVLGDVELTYQNLDSVELGVTTVDTYFDTLGGITRAVRRAKHGAAPPVYIGDQTYGEAKVRTLSEQVALETRTRMLNPKWYEGMLRHGYEGVRQIEVHITNTMGWSATTGQVQPWVYQQLTQTFVLDPVMRERLSRLNPAASAKVANRLLEASQRKYWKPDEQVLQALHHAADELEDRLEGIYEGATA
jgi:magnesium chelatase subunit H